MGLHVAQMTGAGDARVLRRGDGQRRAHPRPRRLRPRARLPRRLRAAGGARSGRSDPPARRAAAGGAPRAGGGANRARHGGAATCRRRPGSVDWDPLGPRRSATVRSSGWHPGSPERPASAKEPHALPRRPGGRRSRCASPDDVSRSPGRVSSSKKRTMTAGEKPAPAARAPPRRRPRVRRRASSRPARATPARWPAAS